MIRSTPNEEHDASGVTSATVDPSSHAEPERYPSQRVRPPWVRRMTRPAKELNYVVRGQKVPLVWEIWNGYCLDQLSGIRSREWPSSDSLLYRVLKAGRRDY
jgi:hypothetical protein